MNALAGRRMSLVNGICVQHDAISASVVASYQALDAASPGNVRLFTYANEFNQIRHRIVGSVGDLLLDPHFMDSSVVIYHFGILYGLFDAILLGNGKARQFVRFHNVTPKEFLPQQEWITIDRSVAQFENMRSADHIWCDSEFNRGVLLAHGFGEASLSTLPLPVPIDEVAPHKSDKAGLVRLVFVGRMVQSKGLLDLVIALGVVARRTSAHFRAFLVGNTAFSDRAYIASVLEAIERENLAGRIHFCGTISDQEKRAMFQAADIFVIPSYHEGFCMPVIEALATGCYVVGYDAGNLAQITNGFGTTVPTGDVTRLADALYDVVHEISRARAEYREPVVRCGGSRVGLAEFRTRARHYAESFSPARYRERFLESLSSLLERTAP